MEKLIEVSETEVLIDFTLGSKCRANLKLRSLNSTTPIAFKIQTSSPHKFLVNPPSGLIKPLSLTSFQIILRPQSHLPHSFPSCPTDKFLIKSAPFTNPPESTHPDSILSWFNSVPQTHDVKLKVALVGKFLLKHAISNGKVNAVKKIIKRQRYILSELTTREAELVLKSASGLDDSEEMVRLLVEGGLKVGVTCGSSESHVRGWNDLHAAAFFDRREEVERMVKCEALDEGDKEGRTAVHLAGSEEIVRVLVGAGADVDARSKDGKTALYRAAAKGDRRLVKVLIELGADPTVEAMDRGRSAIDVARDKGHKEVVEILEQGEAVLNAARRGDLKRLEQLLERDAAISYRDQYGLAALHASAIKGHKDVVMLLVEFGSDLECQDSEGHTALHLAVEGGSVEMVEVLINRGANVNAISKKGATPLQIALVMGYEDISRLLIESGAAGSSVSSPFSSSLSSM
ncbi:hypothetical protein LguiB_029375 [Lonicera macranthoides]